MVRRPAKFYAVRIGRTPGVYETWYAHRSHRDQCKAQVERHQGSRYKSFPTRAEAEAFVRGEDTPAPAADSGAQPPPAPAAKRKAGDELDALPSAKTLRALPETTRGVLGDCPRCA